MIRIICRKLIIPQNKRKHTQNSKTSKHHTIPFKANLKDYLLRKDIRHKTIRENTRKAFKYNQYKTTKSLV